MAKSSVNNDSLFSSLLALLPYKRTLSLRGHRRQNSYKRTANHFTTMGRPFAFNLSAICWRGWYPQTRTKGLWSQLNLFNLSN
jgi:hypothetical protein